MSRGGARSGTGPKPKYGKPKIQRNVALSKEAWMFIAMYALHMDISDNEAIERLVRTHILFATKGDNNVPATGGNDTNQE